MAGTERNRLQAQRIIVTIREVRAEHSACTAREVARRLRMNNSLLQKQLVNLRNAGLVEWTDLAGSLRITMQGGKFAPKGTEVADV